MHPPRNFGSPDVYCRQRWWRFQHIPNELRSQERKEFLQSYQARSTWHSEKRNCCVGDIVLQRQDEAGKNQWPMAVVTHVYKSDNKLVNCRRTCGERTFINILFLFLIKFSHFIDIYFKGLKKKLNVSIYNYDEVYLTYYVTI